jgi:spore coat protein U-like protein
MKKLIVAAVVGAIGISTWVAQAANTSGTFNVNVTLTSTCSLSAITGVDFAYTSFQGGVSNATNGAFTVQCTNTLPYTLGLWQGTAGVTPPGTATIGPITDNAVNLIYNLGLSGGAVPGGATGNGAVQNYNVTGTMAASQGGACTTASCSNAAATNKTHTLIVVW